MDRYDCLILEIIKNHRDLDLDRSRIKLQNLERSFWKAIESDKELSVGKGKVGERITRLYIGGYIENKNGYYLTRKGKNQLETVSIVEL
jgi:hypothetical protein